MDVLDPTPFWSPLTLRAPNPAMFITNSDSFDVTYLVPHNRHYGNIASAVYLQAFQRNSVTVNLSK